jgi:hypothetical protein
VLPVLYASRQLHGPERRLTLPQCGQRRLSRLISAGAGDRLQRRAFASC